MFNKELIMQEDVVIHCDTHEKAKKILRWADEQYLEWCSGRTYVESDNWENYKEETCYCFYKGSFCSIDKWMSIDYKILTYEEVLMKDLKKNKD